MDDAPTSTIRRRGFFRSFAEAADFSDILLNFRILPHKFLCARIAIAAI
jgi:hypothetical protein